MGKSRTKEMFIGAKSELFSRAKNMRNNPTNAEEVLWNHIRKLRHRGFIFRRQHPVDIFIADFYCHKLKLVIEVDGEVHSNEEAQDYDNGRSGELERFGIKVIRFSNEDVTNRINIVLAEINLIIEDLSPPSHSGRGGKEGVR